MNAIANFLPLVASGLVVTQALVFVAMTALAVIIWKEPRHDDKR